MRPFIHQRLRCVPSLPVNPEGPLVVIGPLRLRSPFRILHPVLLQPLRPDHHPLVIPSLVEAPIDHILRPVIDQVCSRRPRRVLFRPAPRPRPSPRKIHQHKTRPADHRLDKLPAPKISESRPLSIHILYKFRKKSGISPLEHQHWFAPEQRRRVPVHNRADVVLVKNPRQPLRINIPRLPLPPHQVVLRIHPQLLPADIQIAIPPPNLLVRPVVRMLLIDIKTHLRSFAPSASASLLTSSPFISTGSPARLRVPPHGTPATPNIPGRPINACALNPDLYQ